MRAKSSWGRFMLWRLQLVEGVDGVDDWPVKSNVFSLRFKDSALEDEFVHHRMADLSSKLFAGGAGVLVIYSSLLMESISPRPGSVGVVLEWRRHCVFSVIALFSVLTMVMTRTPRAVERLRPAVFELAVVATLLVLIVLVCCTEPYYLAKLHGVDPSLVFMDPLRPDDARPVFQDTRLLMALDMIVFVSHLLLPIRWCVLWPVDCIGILAYASMAAFLGSPDHTNAIYNLGLLIILSCVAMMGKRRLECHERLLFGSQCSAELSNDSFEAEMPLSELSTSGQYAETGDINGPMFDQLSLPSVPTTTHTGRMFAELERVDSEVRFKLEKIAEIGHKERWLIEASQVRLMPDCILGSGSFGVVVLASLHGSRVAVKVPKSSVDGSTAWHLPSLGNELRILRHVRHPNVVLFHGACIDPTSSELALVLEYVDGQRLDRFIETAQPPDALRHSIILDICCALRYLHGQRPAVVHGDLKASNILVEHGGVGWPRPKLVDFGLSRLLTRKAKPLGGTLNWMAPELLQNPGMSPAPSADVFSFGRLTFFATTGVRPLADVDRRVVVKMAKRARLPTLPWPENAPVECRELVHHCLEIDATMRPDMVQVHHELMQWRTADPAESAPPCNEEPSRGFHDESLSWRSGLRMVRESLRPIPPNRLGGSAPAGVLAPAAAAPGVAAPGGEADSQRSSSSEDKRLRWDRPLPPPRPASLARGRTGCPKLPPLETTRLPPVLEAETESTPNGPKTPQTPILQPKIPDGNSTESDPADAIGLPPTPASSSSGLGMSFVGGSSRSSLRSMRYAHCGPSVLVLKDFLETPVPMMEISIIDALQRWNFTRAAGSCCVWHAALSKLKEVHRGLRHRSCDWGFALVKDWQCPRCLHMDQLDEDTHPQEKGCDLCGYDPALEDEDAEEEEDEGDEEVEEEEEYAEELDEEVGPSGNGVEERSEERETDGPLKLQFDGSSEPFRASDIWGTGKMSTSSADTDVTHESSTTFDGQARRRHVPARAS